MYGINATARDKRSEREITTNVNSGTLYLCATPIGNLDDITLRALNVLKECHLIAAEDTRHTRKLLSHFDIHTKLISYHAHNEEKQGEKLIERIIMGENIAVVTDAGMPGISDPGVQLVQLAIKNNIKVVPVPGASAVITALAVSGLPTARFVFEGFLPSNGKGRRRQLEKLVGEKRTMVFYESPHRLLKTLTDMQNILGDRFVAVGREITKKHEEFFRGTISQGIKYFTENPPRGEFSVVVSGCPLEEKENHEKAWDQLTIIEHVNQMIDSGIEKKQAIKEVAKQRGIPKREVYNAVEN